MVKFSIRKTKNEVFLHLKKGSRSLLVKLDEINTRSLVDTIYQTEIGCRKILEKAVEERVEHDGRKVTKALIRKVLKDEELKKFLVEELAKAGFNYVIVKEETVC